MPPPRVPRQLKQRMVARQQAALADIDDLVALGVAGYLQKIFGERIGADDLADIEGKIGEPRGAA